jgi:hypothetical protein
MNDEELLAFFDAGKVARFQNTPEEVRTYIEAVKQTHGVDLNSLVMIGEGILVWRKDRAQHPLDAMFMKSAT